MRYVITWHHNNREYGQYFCGPIKGHLRWQWISNFHKDEEPYWFDSYEQAIKYEHITMDGGCYIMNENEWEVMKAMES